MPRRRRANLVLALFLFVGGIEQPVGGQNQMRLPEMSKRRSTSTPCSSTSPISRCSVTGIDHHTVANQVELSLTENAAWNGVKHMLSPIELEGVTSIGPTLETRNDVVLRSQYVHDFPFPFVSPLETEQYVDFHVSCVKLQK